MVSSAGSVTGGSGSAAAAVHTSGAAGGTIDIASSAVLDGSRSGIAILDESGAVVVTTSGVLTGDILTNGGNDTINLTGGSVVGKIDSGADDDTFTWTGGTLTGGFYGQNGSDTAVVSAAEYNGSQVLDGGDDVSVADGWVDSLTLSGVTVTAPGANIVNWETVRLDAANLTISDGALTVGSDPGMGLFLTNGSTLDGLNAFALTGNVDIDGTSTFTATGGGAGVYSVSGDLANAGIVTMQDGVPGDVLTVGGNYTGNGGTLVLDTYLGTDGSASDLLHVAGDTSGTSLLKVVNAGGPGAQTTSDGIRVVQVDGASNGFFSLIGDYTLQGQQVVIGGAYGYALYKNGVVDPADGDWYLRSQLLPVDPVNPSEPVVPIYQPGVPLYEAYPQALLALNGLPTLQQRVGNRYWKEATPHEPQTVFCKDPTQNFKCAVTDEQAGYYEDNGSRSVIEGNGIWGRIEGAHGDFRPAVTTSGTNYDYNLFKLQAGLDGLLSESDSGKLIGGIAVHYGSVNTDVRSFYGNGSIDTQGYGLGANLTWYGTNGFYVDAQGQATWYDSDLYSDKLRQGMADGNNGFGYALSLEAGKRIDLSDGWAVTPQAQLIYSSIDFRSFTDPFGARVSLDDGDSLRGRLGLAVERQAMWKDEDGEMRRLNVYGIANLYNEFLDGTRVDVSGVKFESRNDRLWGGIGVGGSYNWADDKYSVYGEVSANTSLKNFADSYTIGGTVGFRMKW
ncbi:autotransporter outer membrane beta-barrel domain-containing protein [Agrobacterium tumefaciens]|uniref:autotransporter family protein n=1 Tax=Agrobacterium tumefaciens TaxID=358 RepID=UPI001E46E9DF|nr:autotransporter outer membrane beta-barrel domain-containing protein [Agrobacterium tumefaciens]